MSDKLKGILFIVSGPSGVGKGTVIRHIKEKYPDFEYPISCTTRDMRPKEKNGEAYHFMSKEEFEEGIEEGDFLEYAQVHRKDYYGTPKKPIIDALEDGKIIIREVDIQGAHSMKKVLLPENLITIFVRAENEEKLLGRIAKRGELPEEEVARRMESAKKEMEEAEEFDYEVWNYEAKVMECVDEVEKIILDEAKKAGIKV